jgi:hypothetical protein
MKNRKLAVGAAGLCLAVGLSGVAVAANTGSVPKRVTVKQSTSLKFVPNRYIQDGLRFNKDVYKVKSGGHVNFVFSVTDEGPHTLTIVRPQDLPKTGAQVNQCKICEKLGQAHGADPNSEAPPKFPFLENGVGQTTPPNVDRPGDSALSGPNKGDKVTLKVTAKAGKTLHFMCLIHPWMQAKLKVVK